MLTRLAAAGGARRALAGLLALGLAVAYLRQTLPLRRYVDWKGSVNFVADVARRFGPKDVVIFEQKESLHLLSLPLWAVHGELRWSDSAGATGRVDGLKSGAG